MSTIFGQLSTGAIAATALIALLVSLCAVFLCLNMAGTLRKNSQIFDKRFARLADGDRKLEELIDDFDTRVKHAEWNSRNAGQRSVQPAASQVPKIHNTGSHAVDDGHGNLTFLPASGAERDPGAIPSSHNDPEAVDAGAGTSNPDAASYSDDWVEPSEPESYSLDLVERLYGLWTKSDVRPRGSTVLEIVMAEYLSSESAAGVGTATVHIIRDTTSIAEFVRFSAAGAAVGVVLPNPDATFTPVVAHLFPGLTRESHSNPAALVAVRPVSVRQRRGPIWEVV